LLNILLQYYRKRHFTGLSRKKPAYHKNLQKYLNASTYQQIEWINLDQNRIELNSLRKK